ncbi:hypothetical protein [Actinomadura rupiterrae]|uniref:hypothetical protein n=1 Tax=Actinomadura rupiterrae TaxID=559627 RepID=UPI0020A534E9|nr:hypothetical protein [Actinomadura rupiterrae]MCP2335174.1 hypothetical protein [Actinomadura rupiterrae]
MSTAIPDADARTPCIRESRHLQVSSLRNKVTLECPPHGTLTATDGITRVHVPRNGLSVTAYTTSADGSGQLTVARSADGRHVVISDTAPSDPMPLHGDIDNPCTDGTFATRAAWPKGSTIRLRQFDSARPTALDWAIPEGLRRATHAVTDCDKGGAYSPPPDINTTVIGHTAKAPGFEADGTCGDPDGVNTIGFMSLPSAPSRFLAVTCIWRENHRIVEGDIALRSDRVAWWMSQTPTGTPAVPCPPAHYDAVSVATHESLHFLGLAHVQGGHRGLSVTPDIPACSTDPSTLGLGDYRGLIHLYGPTSST